MTIDKAIEILNVYLSLPRKPPEPDFENSIKLSIEALQYTKRSRSFEVYPVCRELPGETEE